MRAGDHQGVRGQGKTRVEQESRTSKMIADKQSLADDDDDDYNDDAVDDYADDDYADDDKPIWPTRVVGALCGV